MGRLFLFEYFFTCHIFVIIHWYDMYIVNQGELLDKKRSDLMKKVITVGLVLVLVLGLGMTSFGQGYGGRIGTGSKQGFGPGMRYQLNEENTSVDTLSELTGLTAEEIYESGLSLHEIAEENNVLDAFLEAKLEERIEAINALVEEGTITETYAELRISQMTEMHEYMQTEDYLENQMDFNNRRGFRSGGPCGRRW